MKRTIEGEKGISILTLDAGSLAGVLSQMRILACFMDQLAAAQEVKGELLPSDHFDLIGASGIAAMAALCIGPLKMSAKEAIEALQVLGLSVFYEHHDQSRETIFDSNELRETVRNIIEGAGYSPDTMIGAVDPKSRSKSVFLVSPIVDIASCHRLRTYRGRKGMLQCTVLEVALASISTLGLFDYAEIGASRRKYTSVGMHHTNPIKDVLDEAEQIFGKEQRVACILSLGSGTGSSMIMPSNLAHLEVHGLLQAMEMQQRAITEEVGSRFGSLEAYHRYSVEGVGSGPLSDWMNWDAGSVEYLSKEYLNTTGSIKLASAVEQLRDRRGAVTLDRLNHAAGTTVTAKKVPPTTPFFVLRKKAWNFVEKNLANTPMDKQLIFLLTGLGGCGKSTLFSHYVQVYGSKYSHIFLVDASSTHNIKTDLQNAVRSLGPDHSQKTWEEALQYFEYDGPNKNWLIGFDSADDPLLPLPNFIPKCDHGTIFITSRNRDLFLLTTPELQWELGSMTAEEALDALLRSAQRSTSPSEADLRDGIKLVERLGGLPLAVVQAGVYCFQRSEPTSTDDARFSFHRYLEEMDKSYSNPMNYSANQSLDGYDKSVYQSLNMSYSSLPQLTRDFLHLCGYFHHSEIPLLMFESAVDNKFQQVGGILPPEVNPAIETKLADLLKSPGGSTTIHLHKIVFSLKMFSLVVTSMTPNSVMLNYHTLVGAWSRDTLSPTQQQLYSAMATRVVSTCGHDKYYLVHTSLIPHIREIVKRPSGLHLNDKFSFAGRFTLGGMSREAEALWRQMYEQCVKEFGRGGERTLIVLNNIANSIRNQGRYEEAAEIEREVLDAQKSIYSEDDNRIFVTQINLAVSYGQQEEWSEAEAILSRLLVVARKWGKEDPRTLQVMSNLASVYDGQYRHKEAMELVEEVLEIRKRVLGIQHPWTLNSMQNLATSYAELGRLDDAQRLTADMLTITKETNGKDHPSTLQAMSNLSNIYHRQGRLGDALILGEEVLDACRRVHGKKHPETFHAISLLAKTYFLTDRVSEGIRLLEELRELEGEDGKNLNVILQFLRNRNWI